MSSEEMLGIPFPVFEGGFTTWENQDSLAIFQPKSHHVNSNSGSDDPDRTISTLDERKQRRKLSNRDSARRSRLRKQKHLEELRNKVNRLRTENRDIENWLSFISHHCYVIRRDNERLLTESAFLRQKLLNIRQVLIFRQLQQFSSP